MSPVAIVSPPHLETHLPNFKFAFSKDDTHARDVYTDSDESSDAVSSPESSSGADTPVEGLVATNDPHHLPTFDSTTLIAPSAPILYLPPLLSSLPPGLGHTFANQLDQQRRPLKTETHLPDIDPVSLALHKALHHFQPVTSKYAETPYEEAFNWSELQLPEDSEREWYCVVFRSRRREGSDGGRKSPKTILTHKKLVSDVILSLCSPALYEADRLAHEEAVQNGGVSLFSYLPHPVP